VDQKPPVTRLVGLIGPRSKKAIWTGFDESVKSEQGQTALVPGLDHDVATGDRDQGPVVRDAVLLVGLRCRHLVVAAPLHLVVVLGVDDVEDGVGAPVEPIGRPAAGSGAAAPLVGEDHRGAVVVERGGVPVGEDVILDGVDPLGVGRIGDVDQQPVALAGAGREADSGYAAMSWHCEVCDRL
jgi:hypothetical protein